MSQQGIYIYGIIAEPGETHFGPGGIGNSGVSTINYRDLAAVVSPTPVVSYDRFDERLLTTGLRTHQVVLENIMRHYSVIPMSFGIIAKSENDVKTLLMTAYSDFKDTLREIDNRVELNVQVTGNEARVLNEVVSSNETLKRLTQELISVNGDGASRLKIELGKVVAAALYQLKSQCRRDILDTLTEVAVASCPGKLTGAEMLINESFLVARDREAEFDREVNCLAETYEDWLQFRYIGPMPPYSFVNLTATVLNADMVDRARNLLGLNEQVTLAEINTAYRRQAKQYHPDSNPGLPGDEEKFNEVTQAFETLRKCVQNLKPTGDNRYILGREQVEGSILVTRRR